MSQTTGSQTTGDTHRVFIINENDKKDPFVEPKVLGVTHDDQVIFTVAGESDAFKIQPDTHVFKSVSDGENVHVNKENSKVLTIKGDIPPNTVHRYTVSCKSHGEIDPIVVVYEKA